MKSDKLLEERKSDFHLSQLASVGQIAAGIAHEVKNPLTAVKGFLQLLHKEVQSDYIDIAQSELENALTTLNNLLQVSKPDIQQEEYQSIHLSVELEAILNLFQDKMYDITFITDFKDTDSMISGMKSQFKKAFFNLIKNAIESIPGKGTITITHAATKSDVVVTIKDTGTGIPEEKLKLLGTPFFTTKEQGTGMGLTQVFTVIYQHGGKIKIESIENQGTKFTIIIPKDYRINKRGVRKLNLQYDEKNSIKDFFFTNRLAFEERLLDEAINVKDKIEEIHNIGNINLLENVHKLVLYIVEEREHELINFAKQEGIAWAKNSLSLAFKLEWVKAFRRTLWDFLYNYDINQEAEINRDKFFFLEKNINELIDQFFTHFFISYSHYKDELLDSQRKLVDNLSVPIIPINNEIYILPLIGSLDEMRLTTIEDKVLTSIGIEQIQTLIIDLSGVADMTNDHVVHRFVKLMKGCSMMGCKTILTGIRSEIVKQMIALDISLSEITESKGTLQLALHNYLYKKEN